MAQVWHKGLHFHIHTQVEDSISTIRPILRSDQLASRLCQPTVSPFHLAVSAAAAHGNYDDMIEICGLLEGKIKCQRESEPMHDLLRSN